MDTIEVVFYLELVFKYIGHNDGIIWIPIQHNVEWIGFDEWPPHFHEIQVMD